ncbi:MAG: hypothetical protein HY924_02945 [Elusimicrobia bacterium]|nr:hypothetical protein [Elusimicrobiota bacterium]
MTKAPWTLTACLAALAAGPALGQGIVAPRCADGTEGVFNGHPFAPLDCPENILERPQGGPPPAPDALLAKKADKKLRDPGPVLGKWAGIVVFANLRYEVFLQVEKGKGKSLDVLLEAKNYRTHIATAVHGHAKPRWTKGQYDAELQLLYWKPGKKLQGELVLGGTAESGPFDRSALLTLSAGKGRHLVLFKAQGPDRLAFRYEDRSGFFSSGPMAMEGELTRTTRDSL